MKRIIAASLCLLVVGSLSGCGRTAEQPPQRYAKPGSISEMADGMAAQNASYRLDWDNEYKRVVLVDKQRGIEWSTTPTDAAGQGVDEFGFPIEMHPSVNSSIILEYLDSATRTPVSLNAYAGAVLNGHVSCEKITDGLMATYYFDEIEVAIPVEYRLRENGISISIDPANIQENKNEVYRIAIAPFFCSIQNQGEDSYLFVPSGSGALIYPKELSRAGQTFSEPVFGDDAAIEQRVQPSTGENVLLPVYGAKSGKKAVCAIIESGAESAYIESAAGSTAFGYTNVYANFLLRGYADLQVNLFSGKTRSTLYAESMTPSKLTVGFYPLYDSEANYTGMAHAYSEYLVRSEGMPEGRKESACNLQIAGGDMTRQSFLGIPYRSIYPATTLEEALDIIREVAESTGSKPCVELMGFGETGLSTGKLAGNYKINPKLGSVRSLQPVLDYCSREGMDVYFDFDLSRLSKSGNGWSFLSDVIKGANKQAVYNYQFHLALRNRDTEYDKYGLLSRSLLEDSCKKMLSKTGGWNLPGIGLSSLSYEAYSDYAQVRSYAKAAMGEDVKAVIKTIRDSGKRILVNSANAYAAANADFIMDAPLYSTQYDTFDEDIPFYQMVFKGYIPLSAGAVNLAVNADDAVLRAVESGCGLTYSLVDKYDVGLIGASGGRLSRSVYEDVKEMAIQKTLELKSYYSQIEGAKIKSHEISANGTRKTVFDNGVAVYVNGTDHAQQTEAGELAAGSYAVREVAA